MKPAVIVGMWVTTLTITIIKLIGLTDLSWWFVTSPLLAILALNLIIPALIGIYRGLKIRIVRGAPVK